MFTYVVQYIKITFLFIFLRVIIQSMFAFNYYLVFQNIICKINTISKTNSTCQWLFYTILYSVGSLGLIDNFKDWCQTTETTTIWYISTIFNHWGVNVELHLLHNFCIANWNHKHFKCICTFFHCACGIFSYRN